MLHLSVKHLRNTLYCTSRGHLSDDRQCLIACHVFIQAKSLSFTTLNYRKASTVFSISRTWKRLLIGILFFYSLSHFVQL